MEVSLNKNEEYKETELGLLPKDWEVVRLGDVITPDRSKIRREDYKGDISIVQKISFDTGQIDFRNKRTTRTDLYVAGRDHLLISKINFHQGAVAITNTLIAATTHYEFYKVSDKADIFYLWRYFRTEEFKNIFFQEIKFRGFKKEANFKFIKNFKIPLPPLSEQKKIASVLSAVQEAKERTEDVIKATKELKKSMMKHLFTYGPVSLEEAENIPLKETEIGPVPEGWEVVRLGELYNNKFIKIQYGFPCGNWNEKGLGTPHIRPFNVSDDGKIVFNNLKYVQTEKNIEKYILQKGDVIFNNTNSEELVGKTAHWDIEGKFVLSNHMTIIRVLNYDAVNSIFLATYMHKKWFDGLYFGLCRRHVNQASISLDRLKQIQIPLPPLSEQKKIASILSAIDQKIEAEENKKKALEDLFKSLLHNLMTAKIRVNHLEKIFDE